MSLGSADPHDSDVRHEKNRILGELVKNALSVVYDVTIFYRPIYHNNYFLLLKITLADKPNKTASDSEVSEETLAQYARTSKS